MIKRFLNSKWLIIRHGVSVVVVFAVLIVALVAISPDISFGWFAKNNTVSANGMAVQANHNKFLVYYQLPDENGAWPEDANTWVPFTNVPSTTDLLDAIRAPGDVATFRIKIENTYATNHDVQITGFGFQAPSGSAQEYPVWDSNGTPRYLSTELHTSLLRVNDDDSLATADPIYFRDGNGTRQIDFLIGKDSIGLNKGGSVIFEVSVGFANTKDDQNVFKNYASNGGVFARSFFFTFDDSSNS